MILPAFALALAFQPAEGAPLPYAPIISVSYVRVTAAGAISCGMMINAVVQQGQGCEFAGEAPEGLRRLGRDATLTMLFSITPDGSRPPTNVDAGELIAEGGARLEIAPDGKIARCQPRIERVLRQVAGVRRPPDFCSLNPVGQQRFEAAARGDPRAVEASAFLYLRDGTPR